MEMVMRQVCNYDIPGKIVIFINDVHNVEMQSKITSVLLWCTLAFKYVLIEGTLWNCCLLNICCNLISVFAFAIKQKAVHRMAS